MITNEVFVLILGVFLGGLVFWAFKRLPEADRLTDECDNVFLLVT